MSPAEREELDDEEEIYLAQYHEALLRGQQVSQVEDTPVSSGHQRVVKGLQACLERLENDRRRQVPSPAVPGANSAAPLRRLGRFQIERELGRGGYGVVFLALDPLLKRQVALKIPHLASLVLEEPRQRFLREARAAAGLAHPHIVPVYEAGEAGSICYLASAYCPGPTLAVWLRQQTSLVAPRRAATLLASLALAMQHAHERGVLHRDLKPSNILLEVEGTSGTRLPEPGPRITDFGLAKVAEADEDITRTGMIFGTPSYMAPEQATGDPRRLGPATDLYALGAILYEMLTGRPPFQGPSPLDTLEQVRTQEPVPPRRLQPTVPRDLERICLKCLSKEPARRYASAAQLADEVHRFLKGEALVCMRPVGRAERLWRWARRNPSLALTGGAAAVLLLLVVVVSLLFGVTATRDAADLRQANVVIGQKQEETDKALEAARNSAAEAVENRHAAERQTVELLLDRGLALCEHGDVATGLLWLARSLAVAERSGAAEEWQRVIRINLGAWGRELRPLRLVLRDTAGHIAQSSGEDGPTLPPAGNPRPWSLGARALSFSPDGRCVLTCQNRSARLVLPQSNLEERSGRVSIT